LLFSSDNWVRYKDSNDDTNDYDEDFDHYNFDGVDDIDGVGTGSFGGVH